MIETLGDVLRNNAYKFPQETAYNYHGRIVTFGEHLERGNRLASALWKRGIRRQDRVSILSQNTIEFKLTHSEQCSGDDRDHPIVRPPLRRPLHLALQSFARKLSENAEEE